MVLPEDGGIKRTAKLNQIEKQSDSGRRLVEYFVVVSSVEQKPSDKKKKMTEADMTFSDWRVETSNDQDEADFSHLMYKPTITARYPLHDHQDNPLLENVIFFCHPSGAIELRPYENMPKVHHFVTTSESGKQIYGTVLTLWEPTKCKPKKTDENGKETKGPERTMFLTKCLVLLSTYPYLAAFREWLTQLHRLSKNGEMILPLERYITNFCSEIPAPPPGSVEVQTTILDSNIKIWCLPHNLPITWVSLRFATLFECLDIDNIILVWHCLALERQVLITSTQLSVLTVASEIFLSLLFPMRWSHAYIPILPTFLIPILSAPMPFLCGINKANLDDALYDLSRDCVLVDLDKNTVTLGPDTAPLPPLPPVIERSLRNKLEDNVGWVFREVRSLTKNDDHSNAGANLKPHVRLMAESMWESKLCLYDEAFHLTFTPEELRKNHLNGNDASGMDAIDKSRAPLPGTSAAIDREAPKQSPWDAVQEAFIDTYVYLLRNYRKFLVFPSKHNEGSYGGAGFRSKDFISAQRYDMRAFLDQLTGTQMYDNFITKRLYGSGEADVAFFDQAVDRFLKTAGMFADVDITGRFSSGLKAAEKRVGGGNASAATSIQQKGRSRWQSGMQKKDAPLLQSARVHRVLKTIVPPEPTGEDLPPHDIPNGGKDSVAPDTSSSRRSTKLKGGGVDQPTYTYDIFPGKLKEELFGTPRPLSAAVISEFNKQRKDAAQFKRKSDRLKDAKGTLTRAKTGDNPDEPPSPEEATFTVFFMAFSAIVGKELVEMANDPNGLDRTILSTYVPPADSDSEQDDSVSGDTSITTSETQEEAIDEKEKEGVAEMKTSRPGMVFDDEDDGAIATLNGMGKDDSIDEDGFAVDENGNHGEARLQKDEPEIVSIQSQDDGSATKSEVSTTRSEASKSDVSNARSEDSKPRDRFHDKLGDLQIEEAMAKGKGQLGLAFEMLTMMKKRGLKADPEAYQCLIDACGRVGDTKRATELLARMHEDGIVADGTVYACLVAAFSADSAWKDGTKDEDLPEWANSTAVEMDWNRLQKKSLIDTLIDSVVDIDDDDDSEEGSTTYQKLKKALARQREQAKGNTQELQNRLEFFVTESVERQIALGENLLEIVFPDISVDTENEVCPRCNFILSDDDVVNGWTPADMNDYTTTCPNCTQRYVPHFCVQCSASSFVGSRGPATPLTCERLSPWVLQKEIRTVMAVPEGIDNLLSPEWREIEHKNAVLWWNLVLSCMRYRFPFTFLLQGSFEQNLIAPMADDN